MLKPNSEALEELYRVDAELRAQVFRPKPKLTLPQWADTYRYLSTQTSNVGGRWRTSRYEVARGPMTAVTEKGVERITAMVSTQTLKTELILNTLGYFAHVDPCPMLVVQPKEDMARAFSKERLAVMARNTPVLAALADDRVRGGRDTLFYKEFPGGFLAMAYAGSPTELAMRAIRVTLLDEIDKYESTKEGDPVLLAEERTSTFRGRRLMIRVCSPTWEADAQNASRIAKSYEESDQRRAFMECPHCGHWQALDFFKHIHWEKSEDGHHNAATAYIYCEQCGIDPVTRKPIPGKEWQEHHRQRAVQSEGCVKWFQTKPFICCDLPQEPLKTRKWEWSDENQVGYALCTECGQRAVSNQHAGFQASKLFNPKITTEELVEKWLAAKDDPEAKQVFYNTQLGLPFALTAMKRIEPHVLTERREKYETQVPPGVLAITCGVDVQSGGTVNEGRLECEVVGWGEGFESWSLDYKVFEGDPGAPMIWRDLDEYLLRALTDASGRPWRIEAACIDSGGHSTESVYKFASARAKRNVWAIKGRSEMGGTWGPTWPAPEKYNPKKTRVGFRPIIIGVNSAKEAIREHLTVTEPGPGYCHFPHDRPPIYFDQLTSERLVYEHKGGRAIKRFVIQRGHANEALDARVYAYAALRGLMVVRRFNFERRKEILQVSGILPVVDETPIEPNAGGVWRGPAVRQADEAPASPVNSGGPRIFRSSFMT
jgi:phage terminase large subunit GpA-like protein